ncbi:MAG: flagellar biosynthesis protein FlhA [Proteobacteria bacterium]|jgi:flagellar biosynthesis protein FlhA|nr:flagellar biosynthesis protein FlhA [Alphaproteobacteria bacterium]NCC03155.1 flagellar biosynthesis protein FlhA [Pseudomonadota bacterium]
MNDTAASATTAGNAEGNGVDLLNKIFRRGEIWLAVGLMAILTVLVLPIPPFVVDIGLSISITFSVLILMTVLFISKPLDFSAFPTVLLISTLLRLSLNLSTTRLVLTKGNEGRDAAGNVVGAFADLVMGGDFIIGIIVFAILTIVNFVVITKGSGRIAEVAARFTLDAMPGKQMAIDADLSSGLIDEDAARARRKELEDEAGFFGSMDGAAKFVRGDAVAGLVITFINAIGGITIGAFRHDMPMLEAADSYVRLTIGDGLVTQVPALLVSVAAGLLVSKSTTSGSTDKALFGQLSGYPMALGLSSGLMGMLAIVPGMPFLPFAFLGAITGFGAYAAGQLGKARTKAAAAQAAAAAAPAPVTEDPIGRALSIDLIRLELGYALLALINSEAGQRLTDQIKGLRRQLAGDMGFIMPSVRIQDNLQLPPNAYVLRIKEIEAGRGELRPGMLLVMDPKGQQITLPGEATLEPTFGLPAMWVDTTHREEALFKGYTVVDPPTVITTHLTEIIKDNMSELLSYAETQKLLDELNRDQQKLVADVIPSQVTLSGLQRVLQNLLAERVSIRDLPSILEGIAEAAGITRSLAMISEHVRSRLSRQISNANMNEMGYIPLLTLSPEWEQAFAESLLGDGEEKRLAMPPTKLHQFIDSVRKAYDKQAMMGESPALLTSPVIRPYVRSIIERFRPSTVVLSQNEIYAKAKIKTLGQI